MCKSGHMVLNKKKSNNKNTTNTQLKNFSTDVIIYLYIFFQIEKYKHQLMLAHAWALGVHLSRNYKKGN
jgi:hypothetical protein